MTDKGRLQFKKQLELIVKELTPMTNELFYLNNCLNDLLRVSVGKDPKYI